MPPKRKAAAAATATKATTTRKTSAAPASAPKSTRAKRAAEPVVEEEPPAKKPARGRKAAKEETREESAVEAPKKRGRAAAKKDPEAEVEDAPAPAKGRGRGKATVAPVEEVPEVEEPAIAPKKRGRAAKADVAAPVITADDPSSTKPVGKRGRTAKKQIEEDLKAANKSIPQILVWQIDMMTFAGCQALEKKAKGLKALDHVLLTAGILSFNRRESPEGWETCKLRLCFNQLIQSVLTQSQRSKSTTCPAR